VEICSGNSPARISAIITIETRARKSPRSIASSSFRHEANPRSRRFRAETNTLVSTSSSRPLTSQPPLQSHAGLLRRPQPVQDLVQSIRFGFADEGPVPALRVEEDFVPRPNAKGLPDILRNRHLALRANGPNLCRLVLLVHLLIGKSKPIVSPHARVRTMVLARFVTPTLVASPRRDLPARVPHSPFSCSECGGTGADGDQPGWTHRFREPCTASR
jgi:hypothetical protein